MTASRFRLERFADFLSFERGLAPKTVSAYFLDIEGLLRWLETQGIEDPAQITHRELRSYVFHLKDAGRAPTTIRRNLSSLRGYFAFLLDEGAVQGDPTELLETPRIWRTLPAVLSEVEVTRLLDAPDPEGPMFWRDRAILELLYATGIRVSELAELPRAGLDLEERLVLVRGKGDKERIVPFGEPAARALSRYLQEVRPPLDRGRSEGRVFLNRRGTGLTRASVWSLVKSSAQRAGIEKTVSPHTLRHSFATHLLEHGADLAVVQDLLGHADIGTTQIYTHLDRDHLRKVHQAYHPRGR
jgi:integrase/recombinase XerD